MKKENNNLPEELSRIKPLFEAIWGNSSIAIYETDAEGQCLSVNNEWCKFAGISEDDALGDGWQQALHPDDKEYIFALWNKHAKSMQPWNYEYRFQTPENVITWVSGTSNPIINKLGEVTGYLGVNTDITERKQKEAELINTKEKAEENERLLLKIAENYPNSFVTIVEKDLTVGFSSGQEFKRQNLNPDTFIGLPIEQVFGEHTPIVKENYLKTFKGEETVFELFINNQHQLYKTVPLFDEKNQISRILSVVENNTKRKQIEHELIKTKEKIEESEKHFRSIIENAKAGYFFIDSEGLFQEVNKAWLDLYKYENSEEIIGKHFANVQQIDDSESANDFVEGIKNGNPDYMTGDFSRNCKDGSVGYHSFSARPVYTNGKVAGIEGFIIDITKQKQAEKELVKAKEIAEESEAKLQELNTTKDKLFSIIAHDLKSPLNGVLGFSKLLIKNIGIYDNEKSKKFATLINTSAKSNLSLIDNLLTWARTQTEQIEFLPKNLELHPIVEEIFLRLNSMAWLKKINLISTMSDDIVAYADQDMLRTILRNLISNAIKFTDSGGKVDISAVSKQDHIEISVADNGVGMNEENQKKLFGADVNFTMKGTANESGSGLGLMLCKEFVDKHGGEIWVESDLGNGSKFVFTLPVFKK